MILPQYTSLMNLVASSLANSFLIASDLSWANRRRRCFFGVAFGSTLRACSISSRGTPGMSAGFHAKIFQFALRKWMSVFSYLSSSPAPIRAVLEGVTLLQLDGFCADLRRWFDLSRLLGQDFHPRFGELLRNGEYFPCQIRYLSS